MQMILGEKGPKRVGRADLAGTALTLVDTTPGRSGFVQYSYSKLGYTLTRLHVYPGNNADKAKNTKAKKKVQ